MAFDGGPRGSGLPRTRSGSGAVCEAPQRFCRGVAVSSLVSQRSLRAGINVRTRRMSPVPVTCYFSCGSSSSSGVSCCMIRHSPLGLAVTTGTEFAIRLASPCPPRSRRTPGARGNVNGAEYEHGHPDVRGAEQALVASDTRPRRLARVGGE